MKSRFLKANIVAILMCSNTLLNGCVGSFLDVVYGEDRRFREQFDTIEKCLAYFDRYHTYQDYWITSNQYPGGWEKPKYYDENGEIHKILKSASFDEIKQKAFLENNDPTFDYIEYHFPFDDCAYIEVKENGLGYICVCPDLNPSVYVYFKTDLNTFELLFLRVSEILPNGE